MAICRASSYLSFLAATTSSNPSAASFATRRTSPLVSVDGSFSHIQNLCAHHEKSIPDLLQTLLPCRSWLSNCFILFLSGIMACAPAALAETDVGFRYPCEDVSSYYSGIDGLTGAPLMKALSSVVSNHRSLRYKDVWDALKVLDAANSDNPEASSEVIEIYTLKAVEKSLAGKPKGWNREHLWPRSYGLKDRTSLTDLHNIRPADVNGENFKLDSTMNAAAQLDLDDNAGKQGNCARVLSSIPNCPYAEDHDPTAPQPFDYDKNLPSHQNPPWILHRRPISIGRWRALVLHPISVCAKGYFRLSPPADELFPPRSRARSQKNTVKWRKYPCLCGSYGTTTAAGSFVVIMF